MNGIGIKEKHEKRNQEMIHNQVKNPNRWGFSRPDVRYGIYEPGEFTPEMNN